MKDKNTTFASKVAEAIRDKGLRKGWVAEKCGITPATLSSFLSGRHALSSDRLERLLDFLEIDMVSSTNVAELLPDVRRDKDKKQ